MSPKILPTPPLLPTPIDGGELAPFPISPNDCKKHPSNILIDSFTPPLSATSSADTITTLSSLASSQVPQPPDNLSGPSIITEADLMRAPMCADHKTILLQHYNRLRSTLDHPNDTHLPRPTGSSTTKAAAREQLARMTLVLGDYTRRKPDTHDSTGTDFDGDAFGDGDAPEVESLLADMIDACHFVHGREGTFAQPAFANPGLAGREWEVAALVQAMEAESGEDVLELWNVREVEAEVTVVPGLQREEGGVAKGLDWRRVLCRAASEEDLVWRVRGRGRERERERKREEDERRAMRTRQRRQRKLGSTSKERLELLWPPAAGMERKRGVSVSTEWSELLD